jgi:hypothetical protein
MMAKQRIRTPNVPSSASYAPRIGRDAGAGHGIAQETMVERSSQLGKPIGSGEGNVGDER